MAQTNRAFRRCRQALPRGCPLHPCWCLLLLPPLLTAGFTAPVFLEVSAGLLLATNITLVAVLRHSCRGGVPHGPAMRVSVAAEVLPAACCAAAWALRWRWLRCCCCARSSGTKGPSCLPPLLSVAPPTVVAQPPPAALRPHPPHPLPLLLHVRLTGLLRLAGTRSCVLMCVVLQGL